MDPNDVRDMLRAAPLFASLTDTAIGVVETAGTLIEGAEGEITAEGASGFDFFLILEGTAEVSVKGVPKGTLGPGDTFGEIALLDGGPRAATVTATSPMDLFGLTSVVFRPLIEHPGVAIGLLQGLCRIIRDNAPEA